MLPDLAFHNPEYLWGLLLVPVLLAWAWRERRSRAALRFSAAHVLARQGRGVRTYLLPLLPFLRVFAVAAAIVALARPQSRDARVRDLSVEGIDIVVALDLSTSMEAGDFRPQNRLHVAKEVLSEFITNRVNDRIGLVVFAGAAYTQAPHALRMFHTRSLILTVPFVAFGIFRFLWLVSRKSDDESPTDSMLKDRVFLLNLLLYAASIVGIIYYR